MDTSADTPHRESNLTTYVQSVFISGRLDERRPVPSRNVAEIFEQDRVDSTGLAYMKVYTKGENQQPENVRHLMVGALVTPENIERRRDLHDLDKAAARKDFATAAEKPDAYVPGYLCDVRGLGPTMIPQGTLVVNKKGTQLWPKTAAPTPATV